MAFEACPQCGSPEIHGSTMHDGSVAGYGILLQATCPRCGFQGQPLRFDDADAYLAYARDVQEDAAAGGATSSLDPSRNEPPAPEAAEMLAISPPRPSYVTALLLGVLGVPLLTVGGLMALSGVLRVSPLMALTGLFVAGVGLAVLIGARRMWTGHG
jgi:rRNA maturation protein Nop10